MQTPVQSLEQLARQNRIKYTVVNNSDTHAYFRNMKNAEETLYEMWRKLTLSSDSDQAKYRVWDYPIKEQYINILSAIESASPVATQKEGFRRVNEHENADFAFIHDSAEIKYEISRNCNLTEVGEIFAEQPYALAVQQGSFLQDELSHHILELQKERFFESLTAKFWNNSARGACQNTDDSEGITLESLGGVFIATLFGLSLAMITLACEVVYYRRKENHEKLSEKDVKFAETKKQKKILNLGIKRPNLQTIPKTITIGGKNFVPASEKRPKVSYISVFPKNHFE